jgi:biopolymer transport protein ExbD
MIQFREFDELISREKWPDLTPMIDMVFLLLIFFLLTSFLSRPQVPVALPESEFAEPDKAVEVLVTIDRNGVVYLNGEPTPEEELPAALGRLEAFRSTKEVLIRADREVAFGKVVGVMDSSKKGGARDLAFLVEWKN